MLKVGDHVRIRRPSGEVVINHAEVVRWAGGEFVFVEADGPENRTLLYGVPIMSVEPIQTPKPSARVIAILRQAFGLAVVKGGKEAGK